MSFFDPHFHNSEPSSIKNYILSVAVHSAIFAAATFLGSQVPKPIDVIEVEYIGTAEVQTRGVQQKVKTKVAAKVESAPAEPEPIAEESFEEDILEEIAQIDEIDESAVEPVEEADFDTSLSEPEAPTLGDLAEALAETDASEGLPELKPIVEDLDTAGLEEDFEAHDFENSDIESELAEADREIENQLAQQRQRLAQQERRAKLERERLEAQAVAAAKKQAELQRRAKARAQQIARAKARAERQAQIQARNRALEKARAERAAQRNKQRSGSNGGVAKFGAPTGVRELGDLKQVPGNPKPRYTSEDRYQRREGEVVFLAYVSSQGTLTQFRLKKSSGHRSLDMRTLQALKRWRFHPGQAGWVELPFSWNLEGDAQEYPSGLRRKVGYNR